MSPHIVHTPNLLVRVLVDAATADDTPAGQPLRFEVTFPHDGILDRQEVLNAISDLVRTRFAGPGGVAVPRADVLSVVRDQHATCQACLIRTVKSRCVDTFEHKYRVNTRGWQSSVKTDGKCDCGHEGFGLDHHSRDCRWVVEGWHTGVDNT